MQTATSETESKSLDLSICVHHYTLRAPCPKGLGIRLLFSSARELPTIPPIARREQFGASTQLSADSCACVPDLGHTCTRASGRRGNNDGVQGVLRADNAGPRAPGPVARPGPETGPAATAPAHPRTRGSTVNIRLYSRSPKNPALQQLQKSAKSASTTPQRAIWNYFATVGVRDFWANGCISPLRTL